MKKTFIPVQVEKDYTPRKWLLFHFGDKYRYTVVGDDEEEREKLFNAIRRKWNGEDSTDEPGTRFPLSW